MSTRLASNSHRYTCLCLPSARVKGMHHHTWLYGSYFHSTTPTYFTGHNIFKTHPCCNICQNFLLQFNFFLKSPIVGAGEGTMTRNVHYCPCRGLELGSQNTCAHCVQLQLQDLTLPAALCRHCTQVHTCMCTHNARTHN